MRRHIPIAVAITAAFIHLALIVRAAMSHTQGTFSYPVDDAYIHLALARHIAFDGVYGVTKYAFSASSSSIVWPWILAGAMRLFGNHITLPLIVNMVAAIGLIAVIGRGLERDAPSLSPTARTLVLLLVVILVPLATLTMIGMEHVLHAALTVAFVLEASRVIGGRETRRLPLVLLGAALVSARYEGIFPVGIAVVLLLTRRRPKLAAGLAIAAAIPVVLFGVYSKAHGWLFFPNSIELKRQHLRLEELSDLGDLLGGNVLNTIAYQSFLLPLTFGTLLLFVREVYRKRALTQDATLLLLAFGTTVAHVELASLGWFYRYEAYLVALDITAIAVAIAPVGTAFSLRAAWRHSWIAFIAGGVAVAVGASPLFARAIASQAATPTACRNIYDQQVQSARFLSRYFAHDTVALNDIGAVAYYGDEHLVDLVGLASFEVAKAKSFRIEQPLEARQVAAFTRDAPVAIIYEEWFPNVPASWVRIGRLRIDLNRVCASNTVAIFATSGESAPRVLAALRDFNASLPAEVHRTGIWIETPPEKGDRWRADTGDALSLEVVGKPDLSKVVWVDDEGLLWMPIVGDVPVRGLSLAEVNEAVRAKVAAAMTAGSWAAGAEPKLEVLEARTCHVLVTGNVLRALDEWVDCDTSAARLLRRAGVRTRGVSEPYLWRKEGATLRRIDFAYDPSNDAAARAVVLHGGDIVVVE